MTTASRPVGSPSLARRVWALPLWAHAVGLAIVLIAGLLVSGPFVAYSSDEGAALLQARQLERGDGWLYRYPLASLDQEDQARPFVRGDAGSKGVAPYAKHPLYPVVLAGVDAVGGDLGVQLLGVGATVVAACLAGLLASRLDRRLGRGVLWLVGVGSPLLFDSYVVMAHGLAAAASAAALLAALSVPRRVDRPRGWLWPSVGVALAVLVGAMLRTEVLLLGPALAVAALGLLAFKRLDRAPAAALGVAGLAGAAGAYLVDRVAAGLIIGTAKPGVPTEQPSSWLAGRIQATQITWFSPSVVPEPLGQASLVLGLFLLLGAAIALHRRTVDRRLVPALLAGACACYVVRLVATRSDLIPGLALAFPAGWFLVWASGRRAVEGWRVPLLALVVAAAGAGVLLTQYAIGGGVEWGGRYFAFLIPGLSAVAAVAAAPVIERHGVRLTRAVVAALVVLSLLVASMSIIKIRHTRDATAALLDGVASAAALAGPSGGLDRPVVVSTNRLLPQLDFRDFDRLDWLVPNSRNLTRSADRLAASGVDRAVLASADADAEVAEMPGWRIAERIGGLVEDVVVIVHQPEA